VYVPYGSAVVGVQVHVPAAVTVAVHKVVAPAVTVTVWPGTPVPETVGVVSVVVVVIPAGGLVSVTLAATHVRDVVLQTGVAPEQFAFVRHCTTTSVPLLVAVPDVAVIVCVPIVSVVDVQIHVPAAVTVAVQITVAPSRTVTIAPAVPVPVMSGVVSAVVAVPPAGGFVSATLPELGHWVVAGVLVLLVSLHSWKSVRGVSLGSFTTT
jgi:hypothetical protein